jgi:protein SCO1/2
VFFGFTHCPEVCPTTLVEMDGWLTKLGDEGKDIRAYFVSIDPERDTPEMMKPTSTNVSDRITGITGEPDKVYAMAKDFGIYWKKVDYRGRRLHDGPHRVGAAARPPAISSAPSPMAKIATRRLQS